MGHNGNGVRQEGQGSGDRNQLCNTRNLGEMVVVVSGLLWVGKGRWEGKGVRVGKYNPNSIQGDTRPKA